RYCGRFWGGGLACGPWFAPGGGWGARRNDPNVLFLTYEELKRDLEACLRRIIAFCGFDVSPERIPEILDRCQFEFMKKYEFQFDPAIELFWERGVRLNSFLRAGRVGDSAVYLDDEQSKRFDDAFRRSLDPVNFPASTRENRHA